MSENAKELNREQKIELGSYLERLFDFVNFEPNLTFKDVEKILNKIKEIEDQPTTFKASDINPDKELKANLNLDFKKASEAVERLAKVSGIEAVEKTGYYTSEKWSYAAKSINSGNLKIWLFKTEEERDEFLKSRVEPDLKKFQSGNLGIPWKSIEKGTFKIDIPRPTPNCSICQWKVTGEIISAALDNHSIRESSQCSAQGDRYIKRMYGNKICKRLYKKVESILPTETAILPTEAA